MRKPKDAKQSNMTKRLDLRHLLENFVSPKWCHSGKRSIHISQASLRADSLTFFLAATVPYLPVHGYRHQGWWWWCPPYGSTLPHQWGVCPSPAALLCAGMRQPAFCSMWSCHFHWVHWEWCNNGVVGWSEAGRSVCGRAVMCFYLKHGTYIFTYSLLYLHIIL